MRSRFPIFAESMRQQRRSLLLWSLALAAISALYLSFYPTMGGDAMDDLVADLPDDMVTALGYDAIGTASGWVTTTVYGLLGPALLLIYAITTGARVIAGEEEAGSLELEAAGPVPRSRILAERVAVLAVSVVVLVATVTLVCWLLILALDMAIPFDRLLAGSAGLLMLTTGFGMVALAVGAGVGRRAPALGFAAVTAVLAFVFDALGPVVEVQWMSEVSPFYWFLGTDPLTNGFDWSGLIKLILVPIVALAGAAISFPRRDLRF